MAVLTIEHRPKTFEDVMGQDTGVKILKAIVSKPEEASRSIVITGPWGVGKTTLARIFGRALSCESYKKTGVICMKCQGCRNFDSGISNRYIEYDASMVGQVSQIRELRPVFELSTEFYRTLVIDEAHLITRQGQSSLLKVIEEGPKNTFFILCSTDPDMILKTIHSRSTPVDLQKIDIVNMKGLLSGIYKKETNGGTLDDEIMDKIVFKSDGHARDALMTLQGFMLCNDTTLLDTPIDPLYMYFSYAVSGDIINARNVVTRDILRYHLHEVNRALYYTIMQLVVAYTCNMKENRYYNIAKAMGNSTMSLMKEVSDNYVQGVFKDKYLAIAFFMSLANAYKK
jgi:DNA polymerase III subunit gamma/tau